MTLKEQYLDLCRRVTRATAVPIVTFTGRADMADPRLDFLRQQESSRVILRAEMTALVRLVLEVLDEPQERFLKMVNEELQEGLTALEQQYGIQYDEGGNIILGKGGGS